MRITIKLVFLSASLPLLFVLVGCGGGATQGAQGTPSSLRIVSPPPPDGTVGTDYGGTQGFSFTAMGGTAPYKWTWSAVNSSLPQGLTLSENTGTVSGTPQAPAVYTLKINVRDARSNQTSLNYTISVIAPAPLEITLPSLPDAVLGAPYGGDSGFSLTAAGGVAPYTWNWAAMGGSSLPSGLTLSPSTGVISGTATTTGLYNFTLTVSDSQSPPSVVTANYEIRVNQTSSLTITSGPLPSGRVGVPYGVMHRVYTYWYRGFPLSASGGSGQYTWKAVSLPPGLGIRPRTYVSGGGTRCCIYTPLMIAGTPITAGNYTVVITVIDSSNPANQVSANYTVNIQP